MASSSLFVCLAGRVSDNDPAAYDGGILGILQPHPNGPMVW